MVVNEMSLDHGKLALKGMQLTAGQDRPSGTIRVTSPQGVMGTANVDKGAWTFNADYGGPLPLKLTLSSSLGGSTTVEFLESHASSVDPSTPPAKAAPASTLDNSGAHHARDLVGGQR
jgi:hypothetical protein